MTKYIDKLVVKTKSVAPCHLVHVKIIHVEVEVSCIKNHQVEVNKIFLQWWPPN